MKIADISVQYVNHMGDDNSVASAARVSFDKLAENYTPEQNAKLIQYLAKHKHYSPFNHTFLTVRVKAPIFVSKQMVKHEYMPWNEVSRRYVGSEPEFYMPAVWRAKADNIKQGSDADKHIVMVRHGDTFLPTNKLVADYTEAALHMYNSLMAAGVCPEQARIVLPHNLMTEWIWSGTLKAFHKMLSLRLDPHTQYETRIVAERILPFVEQHFPISIKALLDE